MFKQTILFGLVVCIVAFSAASGTEPAKPVPASLDEATTFDEIESYAEHAFAESRKDMKTMEDQDRFFETYPPIGIAAGRKIIALGGDDESVENGYAILLSALEWSGRKYPEHMKEFESLVEEIKKTGKFPDMVNNARFMWFYYQSRLLSEKIPKNEFSTIKDEFEALKKEATELVTLQQGRYMHSTFGPMARVLDLAQAISTARNNPRFLDDVLEELIRFVTSDRFENKERKERNESELRGYRRLMTGSPFELWGKTVDGSDFNWADYTGKVVLIDFTASWCGPCREEMPNVVEMYHKYHNKGLEVVCVGCKDTTDNLKTMVEEDKIAFTMISEELSEGDVRGLPSAYYGISGIPNILLIGKDGRVATKGLRGPNLRDSVEKQFAGKEEK